jgi:flagellar basal body-associated protein FliL
MKKAKLDLLEDIFGIDMEMPGDHQFTLDHDDSDAAEIGGKWAFNKLLVIIAPIALIVLIAIGLVVIYANRNTSPIAQKPVSISGNKPGAAHQAALLKSQEEEGRNQNTGNLAATPSEALKIVYLKDFMIDLKDSQGNNYVLMCDVAFDFGGETKRDQLENNTGVRNIVYRTAQRRSVVALRSVEERKKMKKELASELEKLLGEGTVRNVYFMNYFIM